MLIVGLGNPGEQFKNTRHNLGQGIISAWVDMLQAQGADIQLMQSKESLHARMQEILLNDVKITVLYPDVFMNESGKAVMQYLRYNELDKKNILVVHDDLELPLGESRLQESGSAHGHNGMRSIHDFLGDTDIPQLRIGIGRPFAKATGRAAASDINSLESFVLGKFTPEEQSILKEKQEAILDVITDIVVGNNASSRA